MTTARRVDVSLYSALADWYTPTMDSDDGAEYTISHDHEAGTVLHGSTKGDGVLELLSPYGFEWRPYAGVHIPHSRDRFADLVNIRKASQALRAAGRTVAVQIDDHWRPAAVRWAEREERADARTGRYGGYATNAAARSDAAEQAHRRVADGIPLGQPGISRADIKRMDNADNRRRAEADKADHWADRARGAAANETAKHNPRAIMRRIERLEADVRGWERKLADPDTGEGLRRRATLELEKLREDIAHQRGKLADKADAGGFVQWGPEHFRKSDQVNVRGRWCTVRRVNRKSVSVPWIVGTMSTGQESEHSDTVPWDDIYGRRRDGMQLDTPNGEPWPVEQARQVARWERVARVVTGTPERQRRHVGYAQRIARGLSVTATDAELAAFPEPGDVRGRRALAILCLAVFDRLEAGEPVPDVAAAVSPFAGGEPAWTMPAGEPVSRRVDLLQRGDIVAGVYEHGIGSRLVPSMVGPVERVGAVRDRRESGAWVTVRLANGAEYEHQTHVWCAVYPGGQAIAPEQAAELSTTDQRRDAAKRARRVEMAAAKFAAETVSMEPPRYVEPTDENLSRLFAGCVKPPPVDLHDDIRAAFAREYAAKIVQVAAPTPKPVSFVSGWASLVSGVR